MKKKIISILSVFILLIGIFEIKNIQFPGAESKNGIKLTLQNTYTYTEKTITPKITIKYKNNKVSKKQYSIVYYKNNKKIKKSQVKEVGFYKVKITVKISGAKKTTFTKSFKIIPKKISFSQGTYSNNVVHLRWKKDSKVSGYYIEYATNKNFSNNKKINIKNKNTVTKDISFNQSNIYYFRIRSYKNLNRKKIYSKWSNPIKINFKYSKKIEPTTTKEPETTTEKKTTESKIEPTYIPTPSPSPTPEPIVTPTPIEEEVRTIPKKWDDNKNYLVFTPSFTSGYNFTINEDGTIITTNYVMCTSCGTKYSNLENYKTNDTCCYTTYTGEYLNYILGDPGSEYLYGDYLLQQYCTYCTYTVRYAFGEHYFDTLNDAAINGYYGSYAVKSDPSCTVSSNVYYDINEIAE